MKKFYRRGSSTSTTEDSTSTATSSDSSVSETPAGSLKSEAARPVDADQGGALQNAGRAEAFQPAVAMVEAVESSDSEDDTKLGEVYLPSSTMVQWPQVPTLDDCQRPVGQPVKFSKMALEESSSDDEDLGNVEAYLPDLGLGIDGVSWPQPPASRPVSRAAQLGFNDNIVTPSNIAYMKNLGYKIPPEMEALLPKPKEPSEHSWLSDMATCPYTELEESSSGMLTPTLLENSESQPGDLEAGDLAIADTFPVDDPAAGMALAAPSAAEARIDIFSRRRYGRVCACPLLQT